MTEREFPIRGWRNGMNNVFREDLVPPNTLREATNVDFLPDGYPRRRAGYVKRLEAQGAHSLFGHSEFLLYVQDSQLFMLRDAFVPELLGALLSDAPVAYTVLNNEVYFSNGEDMGIVSAAGIPRSWGIDPPGGLPQLSTSTDGSLYAGQYLISITYARENGEESGAPQAGVVSVPENGRINLAGILQPVDPSVTHIRVYLSENNSESLYHRGDIPVGVTESSVTYGPRRKRLETMLMTNFPAGRLLTTHNGRIFAARNKVLYFSRALNYGLYDPTSDYIAFDAPITRMLKAVDAGLLVGTDDGVYLLRGDRPAQFTFEEVSPHPAIAGSAATVPAAILSSELGTEEDGVVWWNEAGHALACYPTGNVVSIREGEVAVAPHQSAAAAFIERNGVRKIVTSMRNRKADAALAVEDSISAVVRRNGIEI